jgi:DNA-binding transcriptional LysR family regulator
VVTVPKLAKRITFRQLQVFNAVLEHKSYSKAGEHLGLTQPAVSSQIRQLEEIIGQPLFEYIGRRLFTTAAGEALTKTGIRLFDEINALQNTLSELDGSVAGDLKIVAVNTAQYVVPYLLRGFLNLYPQVRVSVAIVNRAAAISRLESNSDDLVIMGMVPTGRPYQALPFLDNELIPVVPNGHPLLEEVNLNAQTFLDSQLLIREPGSGSRLALETHCERQRLRLRNTMELGSNDALKHAVMAGLGVAILPKLSILPELKLGQLIEMPLPDFPIRRSWSVVYPQGKHATPAMRAFIDYIQQNIKHFEQSFIRRSELSSHLYL